jgi:hypothetical protein
MIAHVSIAKTILLKSATHKEANFPHEATGTFRTEPILLPEASASKQPYLRSKYMLMTW